MTTTEAKLRLIHRIQSTTEWPDNGEARLGLIQAAYELGEYQGMYHEAIGRYTAWKANMEATYGSMTYGKGK
jgi:hypothetical protein